MCESASRVLPCASTRISVRNFFHVDVLIWSRISTSRTVTRTLEAVVDPGGNASSATRAWTRLKTMRACLDRVRRLRFERVLAGSGDDPPGRPLTDWNDVVWLVSSAKSMLSRSSSPSAARYALASESVG